MDTQLNYLGATIFWLYIIAALFFTGLVIFTITNLPRPSHASQQKNSRDVAIFSALACVSFVATSYNMLNVLIESFLAWRQRYFASRSLEPRDIWRWSIESTLFQNFAEALVETKARQYWMHGGLIATMSVSIFMGYEGNRRSVPRLWAFFCLSQILPISFTQNLFYIALLRLPDTTIKLAVPRRPAEITLFVYVLCELFACTARTWLLPIILMTRLCLFAPLIIYKPRTTSDTVRVKLAGKEEMQLMLQMNVHLLLVLWLYIFWSEGLAMRDVFHALFSHPAVSSLGCDFVISILSVGFWMSLPSRSRTAANLTEDGKT